MEFIGLLAFIFVLTEMGAKGKARDLEKKMIKLERKLKGEESEMSKIISDLKGKRCKLTSNEFLSAFSNVVVECIVLDSDDEWIRVSGKTKKDENKEIIIRIDNIDSVEVL